MKNHGKTLIEWKFPEFIKPKRTKAWYFWAILIGGGLFIWAIITFNLLFALIILMSAIILLLHGKREPQELEFKITEDGFVIASLDWKERRGNPVVNERFYLYKKIKSFYIIYEPPQVKNLYFQFKSGLRPRLSIPLENQSPLKVRKILLKYLEEDLEKDSEPFSEQLGRILKL
jgi:hypothetical protein